MAQHRGLHAGGSTPPLLLAAAVCCCMLLGAQAGRFDLPREDAALARVGWRPPRFCRGKDCPEFTIVETRDDVELRRYKRAHWISTNVSNAKWSDAYQEGYDRLQKYVGGDNANSTRLPQTNPSFTLLYVADAKAHTLQSTYTVEYFVPFELQDAPPAPTAKELAVTPVVEQNVWVLSFGGFATEETVVTRGFEFIDNLTGDGIDIHTEFIGLALYDQPARLIRRHNELWLWPKDQPSLSSAAAHQAVQTAKTATVASARVLKEAIQKVVVSSKAAGEKVLVGSKAAAEGLKKKVEDEWETAPRVVKGVVAAGDR